MNIDWSKAPEGATHFQPSSGLFRVDRWFKDDFASVFVPSIGNRWIDLSDDDLGSLADVIERPTSTENPKTLTQAVFDGLPSEYRWAVVDNRGSAYAFNSEPQPFKADFRDWDFHNVDTVSLGMDYDASDWQNSLIERQDAPKSADIDWSRQDVPEGATHCVPTSAAKYWYKKIGDKFHAYNGTGWNTNHTSEKCVSMREIFEITRPESITDVARSIEEARIEEQSERTYPHYFKDVSGVDAIDLYHVARLYDIADPALFHAFKKIACAGKRGAKDQAQDVQEAIDALKRWQELNK